jgi:starch synthase
MQEIGLDPVLYHPEGVEFNGMISFLKGGIVFSDAVTTVSPTYAREIQTPEYGFGFDGLLRSRRHKLRGILNGVDYVEWNPETDPHLPAHFSSEDLSGKEECKRQLLAEIGLPHYGERPLIGIVSRFADQKGFDLVAEIAAPLADENVSLAILGSGDKYFEDMFRYFGEVRPDKFGVTIGYNNALAHRIEAGSDMFLMPSRYEPCGLNQIYSLRYGTVPIVRATGGLDDTVDSTTGFKFADYSPAALAGAIGEALQAWQSRDEWVERMRLGMSKDFSWEASAAEYQTMYAELASL